MSTTTTTEARTNGGFRDAWRNTPRPVKQAMGIAIGGTAIVTGAIGGCVGFFCGKKKGAKKAKELFYSQQNGEGQQQEGQENAQQGQPNQQAQQNQQGQAQQQTK